MPVSAVYTVTEEQRYWRTIVIRALRQMEHKESSRTVSGVPELIAQLSNTLSVGLIVKKSKGLATLDGGHKSFPVTAVLDGAAYEAMCQLASDDPVHTPFLLLRDRHGDAHVYSFASEEELDAFVSKLHLADAHTVLWWVGGAFSGTLEFVYDPPCPLSPDTFDSVIADLLKPD